MADTPIADPTTPGQPLAGKTVVITGASAGIGAAAAGQLAALGARIIALGRSPSKTAAVAERVGGTGVVADFARFSEVRRAAAEVTELCPRIDVLVNNAGGLFPGATTTDDGHGTTVQVNHLAPFLLTGLLMPRLVATPGSRVVITSSVANIAGRVDLADLNRYPRVLGEFHAYADSKLMNILFARELARRAASTGPTATAVHPGLINSEFGRDAWIVRNCYRRPLGLLGRATTVDNGAEPLVAVATRPDPESVNGAYLHRYRPRDRFLTPAQARDPDLARELWDLSAKLVDLPT
ncbi:SDR family NAD(P)-dependent oxidoreductase [Pseudofrankia sp. DC12]|uniref:SDR family NAD(P)-dependent oxidoreductase n=1 Tax=Pseudofrankia sp. DC12 TaxID=683315 RepID=UPI0005F834BD|nr:SDR family NAD(P)-dependent oxidoreductase [Pseudofrankia sp. DC12]